jgi:hypothetical protein
MVVWFLLFGALVVVLTTVIVDSPLARAWMERRIGGSPGEARDLKELSEKLGVLESELEVMARQIGQLQEEQQFLQRLLEEQTQRPAPKSLPKSGS